MTRLRCLGLALILVAVMASSPHAEGHDATLSVGSEYTVKFLDVASDPHGDAMVSNGTIAFHGEHCVSWSRACRIFVHNIITGETWDTGYAGTLGDFQYPYLVFEHEEHFLGDLDGDGYSYDRMLVVYDVVARNGHMVAENFTWSASVSDGRITYNKVESYNQVDYNKDGDLFDVAVFLYDISERSETLAGVGIFPLLVGQYLFWYCQGNDLCSLDVVTHRSLAAKLPWRYPNFHPEMRSGDGDTMAIAVYDEGDYDGNGVKGEHLLASFNMSTGAFKVHLDAGGIAFLDLSLSGGKVLAYQDYRYRNNDPNYPQGYFVYDLATGETTNLSTEPNLQYPLFHANSVVANVNVWCVSPPEFDCHPRSNPRVVLHNIRTGETRDLSACCVVREWSGAYDGDTIVLTHNEHVLGVDFNNDGDLEDEFVGYATTLLGNQRPLLTDESHHHPSVSPIGPILLCFAVVASLGLTVVVLAPRLRKRRVT